MTLPKPTVSGNCSDCRNAVRFPKHLHKVDICQLKRDAEKLRRPCLCLQVVHSLQMKEEAGTHQWVAASLLQLWWPPAELAAADSCPSQEPSPSPSVSVTLFITVTEMSDRTTREKEDFFWFPVSEGSVYHSLEGGRETWSTEVGACGQTQQRE